MLALQHGFASLDLTTEKLSDDRQSESHLPDNRFNDGKCDPARTLLGGNTIFHRHPGAGSLYAPGRELNRPQDGRRRLPVSNGIAWSLDHRTVYYIDSMALNVRCVRLR